MDKLQKRWLRRPEPEPRPMKWVQKKKHNMEVINRGKHRLVKSSQTSAIIYINTEVKFKIPYMEEIRIKKTKTIIGTELHLQFASTYWNEVLALFDTIIFLIEN